MVRVPSPGEGFPGGPRRDNPRVLQLLQRPRGLGGGYVCSGCDLPPGQSFGRIAREHTEHAETARMGENALQGIVKAHLYVLSKRHMHHFRYIAFLRCLQWGLRAAEAGFGALAPDRRRAVVASAQVRAWPTPTSRRPRRTRGKAGGLYACVGWCDVLRPG